MDTKITNITIPSMEEYAAAKQYLPEFASRWWLREPVCSNKFAACVGENGEVHDPGWDVRFEAVSVRPALLIEYIPEEWNYGDRFIFGGHEWVFVPKNMAVCVDGFTDMAFKKTQPDGEVNYETSDIRPYLNGWLDGHLDNVVTPIRAWRKELDALLAQSWYSEIPVDRLEGAIQHLLKKGNECVLNNIVRGEYLYDDPFAERCKFKTIEIRAAIDAAKKLGMLYIADPLKEMYFMPSACKLEKVPEYLTKNPILRFRYEQSPVRILYGLIEEYWQQNKLPVVWQAGVVFQTDVLNDHLVSSDTLLVQVNGNKLEMYSPYENPWNIAVRMLEGSIERISRELGLPYNISHPVKVEWLESGAEKWTDAAPSGTT